MTREKREIIRRIDDLQFEMEIESQLNFGNLPEDGFEPYMREIHSLEERLSKLRHYDSVEDMYFDTRGFVEPDFQFSLEVV